MWIRETRFSFFNGGSALRFESSRVDGEGNKMKMLD